MSNIDKSIPERWRTMLESRADYRTGSREKLCHRPDTLELRIKLRPLTVRCIREQFPCLKLMFPSNFPVKFVEKALSITKLEKILEMQRHPDAIKMMSFFPYGDDVRALEMTNCHDTHSYQNKPPGYLSSRLSK
ncbi:7081_t:CDS:2 [Funneliformis mosseae]|uniref:7081_t:CDS:1 n=1 Tax=Funneliformis mosseae TaxID=27381 RepID=A0A9N9DMN7_FUNMO|nr:7081_t:CDS:2 [Funneliformis mosseae]